MQIYGIDITSTPSASKPLTCALATLSDRVLRFERIEHWDRFEPFEELLSQPGPWIAGIDSPFSQSRRLLENLAFPEHWEACIHRFAALDRATFRKLLVNYRTPRPAGDKHHYRHCDRLARSQSPQTIDYTPVGLMFHEVAPRLVAAGVHVPVLQENHESRVVAETYPGVCAREILGEVPYKNDNPTKQNETQLNARTSLLQQLRSGAAERLYNITLDAPLSLAHDPTGDELDALLCALQAAWCWTQRDRRFGAPQDADPLEGWIHDPTVLAKHLS